MSTEESDFVRQIRAALDVIVPTLRLEPVESLDN